MLWIPLAVGFGAVVIGLLLAMFVRRVAPVENPARGRATEEGTGHGLAIDADRFYHVVVDLLEALGLRITYQALHGKGEHDIMARSDAPVTGGLYIVHAFFRPEHGVVDSTRVLNLLDTVKAEEAARGILITTHSFSEEAVKVSDDPRIELIDGEKLEKLVRQYVPNSMGT